MAKKPVTDPGILAELNGPVTDPEILAELNGGPSTAYPSDAIPIMPRIGSSYVPDFTSPLARLATGFVEGVSLGNAGAGEAVATDPRYGPPTGFAEKSADIIGNMVGMSAPLMGAMAMGASAPVAFGATGALHPAESMQERAVNAAAGAATGAAFHYMNPALAGIAGRVLGPQAVAPAMETLSRPVMRAANMYLADAQMRASQGVPIGEALTEAIPATAAMHMVPGEVFAVRPEVASGEVRPQDVAAERIADRAAPRQPVEPSAKAEPVAGQKTGFSETVSAMDGAATEPVRGVTSTEMQSKFLRGEVDDAGYAAGFKDAADRVTGVITETRMVAARKAYLTDKKAASLAKRVENGEMSAEDADIALREYTDRISATDPGPLGGSGEAKAREMALEESIPEELRVEVLAGRVRDYTSKQSVDPRRFIQGAGGRKVDNVLERHVLRQNEFSERTTVEIENQTRGKLEPIRRMMSGGDRKNFGAMMKIVGAKDTAESVVAKPEFAEVAAKFKSPQAVLDAAIQARAVLEAGISNERTMLDAFGIKQPGYLETYWPSTEKPAGMFNIKGRIRQFANEPEYTLRTDARAQGRQFDPRLMQKTGSVKNEDLDFDVLMDWAVRYSRTMGHTPAIVNNEAIAEYLKIVNRREGAPEYANLPTAILNITESKYNNKRYGLAGSEQAWSASSKTVRAAQSMSADMKQAFNRSNYLANPNFNLFTQWTSSLLGSAAHPVAGAQALIDMFNPRIRSLHDNSYAGYMKRQRIGKMSREGQTDAGARARGLSEKAEKYGGIMSQAIEREVGVYSYALGARVGAAKGWTPKQVDQFASDMIAGTQSMYDNYNRAEILKSIFLNFAFPAQSYGVEVKNFFGQRLGNKYGTEYMSKAQGYRTLLSYLAAYMTWEYIREKSLGSGRVDFSRFEPLANDIKGEKKFSYGDLVDAGRGVMDLTAVLPFAQQTLGTDIGEGKARPAQLAEDFGKTMTGVARGLDALAAGDEEAYEREFAMAYARVARVLMIGGAQQYKAISSEMMFREGKIPEDERMLGAVVGPYSTPTMAEEMRKKKGRGSGQSKRGPYTPRGRN